jgi:C-terminal processing protease CtpA/Prc
MIEYISKPVVFSWPLLLVVGSLLAGCSSKPVCGEMPISSDQRTCLIDEVDRRVRDDYPFAQLNDLDLEEWSDELRSLDDPSLADDQFLRRVQEQVAELQDGHTNFYWPDPDRQAVPPIQLEMLEAGCFVSSVRRDGLSVERGDRVIEVDGEPVRDRFEEVLARTQASTAAARRRQASFAMLAGRSGTEVSLTLEGGRSVTVSREQLRSAPSPEPVSKTFGDIGYIAPLTFRYVDDIDRIDRLLNDLLDRRALVIDLRTNGGGASAVADALLARLFDDELAAFEVTDRSGEVTQKVQPGQRGRHFDGPIAVLTNAYTFSAANYFVQRIRYHDRGVVVGRRSGGGSGVPRKTVALTEQISLRVTSGVMRTPEGSHAEKGVPVDVSLPLGQEFLTSSPEQERGEPPRDRDLRRALEYLRERIQ